MQITIEDILKLKPCEEYGSAKLEHLAAGRESVTLMEITELPIPFEDVLWVISLLINGKHDRELRLFACDCAEHVLHLFEKEYPDDKRPREAIAVSRRYANGEATDGERSSARNAARAAARDAAWAASIEAEQKLQLNKLREYIEDIEG